MVIAVLLAAGIVAVNDDVEFICKKIEAAVLKGRHQGVDTFVRHDALFDRVEDDMVIPKWVYELNLKKLKEKTSVGRTLCAQAGKGAGFKFLKLVERGDDLPSGLFRVVNKQSFGFIELVFEQERGKKPRVVDVLDHRLGELFSATLRWQMTQQWLLSESPRGIEDADDIEDLHRGIKALRQIRMHAANGELAEALEFFPLLPQILQKRRDIQLERYRYAFALGDPDELDAALNDSAERFGADPYLGVVLIDGYIRLRRFVDAFAAMDRIEKAVGSDPSLLCLTADIQLAAGDVANARENAKRAINEEPALVMGYRTWANVTLVDGDFAETVRTLKFLKTQFDLVYENIESNPDCAEFVASPEYRAWKEEAE